MAKATKITPAMAKRWLSKMPKNRPCSQSWVRELANRMKSGHWDPNNGETIKFNKSGHLVDGQHRLEAIILAGVDVWLEVRRNVSDNAFETIDNGKKRSAADTLALEGYKNYTQLASAIRYVHALRSGTMPQIDNVRMLDLANRYKGLVDSIDYCRQKDRKYFSGKIGIGIVSAIHFEAERNYGTEVAESFTHSILSGEGLNGSSPELCFRNYLTGVLAKNETCHRTQLFRRVLKCFHCSVDGKKWDAKLLACHGYRMQKPKKK